MSATVVQPKAGRYDSAQRRRSVRRGRERGCWVYIPQEELQRTGMENGDPPLYRLWASTKGRLRIQLYRTADTPS